MASGAVELCGSSIRADLSVAVEQTQRKAFCVRFFAAEVTGRDLMPDIISGQPLLDQRASSPEEDPGSVRAVITRGWNAYLIQVVLVKSGQTCMLVGKEVVSYTAAEAVARLFAATHGIPWEKVEMVLR